MKKGSGLAVSVDAPTRKRIEETINDIEKKTGIKLSIRSIVNASLKLYLDKLQTEVFK